MKSLKTLFKTAYILSLITMALIFIIGILLIFDVMGLQTFYYSFMGYGNSLDNSYIIFAVISLTFDIFVNSSCAKFYKVLSSATEIKGRGTVLFIQAVIQTLFLGILPAIIIIITGFKLNKQMAKTPNTPINCEIYDERLFKMRLSIEKLKLLKEKGEISEKEYFEALNKIISN